MLAAVLVASARLCVEQRCEMGLRFGERKELLVSGSSKGGSKEICRDPKDIGVDFL
jgi:hypothetical protein